MHNATTHTYASHFSSAAAALSGSLADPNLHEVHMHGMCRVWWAGSVICRRCVVGVWWMVVVKCRVPRGASAAAAYQKLFRGAAHLVPSQSAPQAECKARSETAACAFLITQSGRTGKYAHADRGFDE